MQALGSLVVLVGTLAAAVLGFAPYSNDVTTETAAPQELGFVTSAGSLVYSLNVCTVVHSTACQISMSTRGGAPPAGQSSTAPGPEGGYSTGTTAVSPAQSQPSATSAKQVSTVLTTTNSGHSPTVVTQDASSALSTGEASESPTGSEANQPSSSAGSPPATSIAAGNTVSMRCRVVAAAAALALAFLF